MPTVSEPKATILRYEEAPLDPVIPPLPGDLPKADFSAIARTIAGKRYLKKGEDGEPIEEVEDMFWRVAWRIAFEDTRYGASPQEVKETARTFYRAMTQRFWLPNSPTLMNAGRPLGQLSACFVLPVDDCISNGKTGIYDTLRAMALVHQSGGGTGFSFSRLRPAGAVVRSTTGVASGPVSFMSLYDGSTEVVKQGGTRRGANMGILRCDHPDIRAFIECKSDTTKITNFNISVGITDAFMKALREDGRYDLVDPRTGEVTGQEDANAIFDLIVHGAWATGEPGVFFIDEANRHNPVPHLGSYEATNPCGEQPLLPFDVCNLGSVNVGAYYIPDVDSDDWRDHVDWDAYRRGIHSLMHFLDNVIDANRYPLEEIHDLAQRIRRVGAGLMGVADLLIRLRIPYDGVDGVQAAREINQFFDEHCKEASENLARVRGVFPEWAKSIWGPDETCARDPEGQRIRPMRRLRHCNVNTVAPTGTISIFAGCSSGIEPLFAVAFMRNQAGEMMPDVNEDFVRIAKEEGWHSEGLMRQIAEEGHIHFEEVPVEIQKVFRTAHDISPEWHVRMQAAFQENIDSAISKTTNFPREANEDDVREIYLLAHQLGCKGVTVYRDGSREGQVLSTGKTTQKAGDASADPDVAARVAELEEALQQRDTELRDLRAAGFAQSAKRSRPAEMRGRTRKIDTPLGTAFVTINEDDAGSPFEVFVNLGKAGGAATADAEAIGRLISMQLRSGHSLDGIVRQLRGISSDRAVGFGPNKVLSVPDAIAQVLQKYLRDKSGVQEELALGVRSSEPSLSYSPEIQGVAHLAATCPECESQMEMSEGCMKCRFCAHSECS